MTKPKFTIENWIPEKFHKLGIHVENEEQIRALGSKNLTWLSNYWSKKTEAAKKKARYAEIMYGAFYDAENQLKREKVFPSKEDEESLHSHTMKFFEAKLKYADLAEDYHEAAGMLGMMAKRADDKPSIFTTIQYKEGDNVMVYFPKAGFVQGLIVNTNEFEAGKSRVIVGFPEAVAAIKGIGPSRSCINDGTLMKLATYHYFERDPEFLRLYVKAKSSESHYGDIERDEFIQKMVDDIKYHASQAKS